MSGSAYRYLTVDEVRAINVDVMSKEGNSSLLRDRLALDSALNRPRTAAFYEQADLVLQASILIMAVALAHAFLDGNKRTAMIAGAVFLDLNGYLIDVESSDDALGRQIEAFVDDHEHADEALRRFYNWLCPLVLPKT